MAAARSSSSSSSSSSAKRAGAAGKRQGDMTLPVAAAGLYGVGFSAFLMDEPPPDPHARPSRNGARPRSLAPPTASSAPVALAAPPPPPSHAHAVHLRALKKPPAAAPAAVTTTTATATATMPMTAAGASSRQDDIPVLEGADDDDVAVGLGLGGGPVLALGGGVGGDSDDDDDDDAAHADELADDVPVLQTLEDAQRMGSKKFSWRESTRQAKRKKSRAQEVVVPGAEALLRMSSATDFLASGSLVARKEALAFVDKQIVLKGWLYKQADILRTWKRRYFVLIKRTNKHTGEFSAALQYYKGTNFAKLRGEMSLQDGPLSVRFVEASETKRPYCFEISGPDYAFVCQGSGHEDVSAWVCHLQSLAASAGGENVAAAVGTAAASGLHPGGLAAGAMDDRSIRIVAELRRLLHTSKSSEAAKCRAFIKGFEARGAGSLRQLRDFHAALTGAIMKDHASRIMSLLEETNHAGESSSSASASAAHPRPLPPVTLSDVRSAVSRHVEEVLFVPLQEQIHASLRRAFHEDEAAINKKVRWLQGKDQTYYNIPLHQISWKEWRRASRVLAQMGHLTLPSAKYDVLVSTIETIQAAYRDDHQRFGDTEPLETDDIIPIFTYVLANSGLENLLSVRALLTELNGSWAVGGSLDDGAALSVLSHAIDLVCNVSIPAVLEDIFKDQITLSIDGDWHRVLEFDVEPTYRYGAIVHSISSHGYSAVGSKITRGHVLVTVNGQNVVLWPFQDIAALLKGASPPFRLAFIPSSSYFKILTSNKSLWNVALIHACQRGDVCSVQMLLANGADVNYVAHESGGNTPLHIAVSALHFNVVSYILQHGAKVKAVGECGRTALHMVGAPCTLPSASSTLGASVVPPVVPGNSLRLTTSASGALRQSDRTVMIIKKLLAHGAELETRDIYGNTPLMLLAERGCLQGVDVLIEADGHLDLNARNWKSGINSLALAARAGRFDVVEALLDYGVQVDVCTLRGESALHFAAGVAHREICRILVEKGCDIDARTNSGMTPLMVAAARGNGLTPNVKTATQRHTMHVSDVHSSADVNVDEASVVATIDFFLAHGADKDAVCGRYRLPLHFAAMFCELPTYAHLLAKMDDSKAAGEIRDIYGDTANAMLERNRPSESSSGVMDLTPELRRAAGDEEEEDNDDEEEEEEDDDDSDEEEDEEDEAPDIPMSLSECQNARVRDGAVSSSEIVTEDRDGVVEIVAGTFRGIMTLLFQADNYRYEDIGAFVGYCYHYSLTRDYIAFLRELLSRHAGTPEGMYVRRMVLHALNKVVVTTQLYIECDEDTVACISDFCNELFPIAIDDDPQCAQWVSASQLPQFVAACREQRLQEFLLVSYGEEEYTALKQFLVSAKQNHAELKFLDDELFASAKGIEIITESMRRRLSIAGVWSGDVKNSFVVKSDDLSALPPPLERLTSTASMITPWQPRGANRSLLGERNSRSWILDLDPSVVAQQITLFQHYLFSKIKVSEVLAPKRSAEKTPAYERLRLLHNHISVWVVSQILARDEVDQRAEVLSFFIKVAGVLLNPLQNLDGFMAVMNATNDSSIFRLKMTWGRLSPQTRDAWHELKQYTEKGARPLNKLTKEGVPPLIPYMGVVIQNIIAMQEFPNHVEGGRINYKKIRSIGSLMSRFISFQQAPYLLPTDKRVLVQDYMCTSVQYPDTDACFARSLK
ncbi:hypothetical protein PybrP1_004121, partial [[Pythium] brassicae (nom. inval.)]